MRQELKNVSEKPNPVKGFAEPPLGGKAGPRHQDVAKQLAESIAAGVYPIGSLLPTENDLIELFKVSRYTIREAVGHLQKLGLVDRRQGHGTVVKSDQSRRQFKLAIRTFSDIENSGYFTHLTAVRSQFIVADNALANELPCAIGDKYLHFVSKRIPIDDTIPLPVAWNEAYIIKEYAGIQGDIGKHKGPVYTLLERAFSEKISAIEQDVSAVELNATVAKVLSLRARSPGLRVKRSYIGRGGRVVMVAYNTYPPDPFTFNMRLEHE